jgi:hypothetical protein
MSTVKMMASMSRAQRWLAGLLVAAAVAALGGCAGSKAAAAGQQAQQLAEAPDALIQMRRGGCPPNRCPVYGVSIFMDGTVVYEGRVNVGVVGQRSAKLPPGRLSELIAAIEAMDFMDIPEGSYVCADDAGAHLTILDYRPGSVEKTVLHDEACGAGPVALRALERAIDQAANVQRWTAPARAVGEAPTTEGTSLGKLEADRRAAQ